MDELSKGGAKLVELMKDQRIAGTIGTALAEVAIELADAKAEAKHWKQAFEVVRGEIMQLGAVLCMRAPDRRVVIYRRELEALPPNMTLHYEAPEDGVRIYELKPREADQKLDQALKDGLDKSASVLLPAGHA